MFESIFWICLLFIGAGLFGVIMDVSIRIIDKIDEKQTEKELAEKIKAEKLRERTRL